MPEEIDPLDQIAQDEDTERKRAKQRAIRQVEIDDFKGLMDSVSGRRFVWRLLDKTGVFRSTFRTTSEMAFLEGMRNVGLLLVSEIHELCPEKYHLMVREQESRWLTP